MLRRMMTDKFLDYLRLERNYSEKTITSYKSDLRAFESFLEDLDDHLTLESVDSDVIRLWMESMVDSGDRPTTVKRRLSCLRSFYRFALARKFVSKDPAHAVASPKVDKPLPSFLQEKDMERLLDGEVEWGNSFKETRARTIIILLYETGLRASELMDLNNDDVDFVNSQLKVTGKRNKQRIIPFGEELKKALIEYIAQRDAEKLRSDNALFVGDKGRRLYYKQLRAIVVECLSKVTTIKKRSPHVLRHTFATTMLNNGANLESIRQLLGHKSLSTTEVYTHTTFEQLKRIYKQAHPRA